jgi:His-Xaa-Ser system protein HxsD
MTPTVQRRHGALVFQLSKAIYEKDAVLAAAYALSGLCSNRVEPGPDESLVTVILKPLAGPEATDLDDLEHRFLTEILDQQFRLDLERRYGDLRRLIIQHAFSPWRTSSRRSKKPLAATEPYLLLPFRFGHLPDNRLLVVSEAGEFVMLRPEDFSAFTEYRLEPGSPLFLDLKARHLLTDTKVTPVVNLLATKYRTKKAFLKNFTGLHIVVVTLRCNQRCHYCHASSQSADDSRWDMSPATAKNVVDKIMATPSPVVKIEFQGGESLLNLKVVKDHCPGGQAPQQKKAKRPLLCHLHQSHPHGRGHPGLSEKGGHHGFHLPGRPPGPPRPAPGHAPRGRQL